MAKTKVVSIEMLLKSKEFQAAVKKAGGSVKQVGEQGKALEKQSQGMFKRLRAGWLAVAGAVIALTRAMKKAIEASAENEAAQLKFQKVFRGSIEVAQEARRELTTAFAMSGTEATKMLSKVQDMLVPMGLMRDRAAELSGNVIKLAADISVFNGKPTEEVLNAIQSAMVGMNRPMLNYGVNLTAATVKQEAFNMGLYEGTGELDAAARAQAALSLITKGSADALGATAEQWDTLNMRMKRAKAFAADIENIIGDELVRALEGTMKAMDDLQAAAGGLEDIQKNVRKTIQVFQFLWQAIDFAITAMIMQLEVATEVWINFFTQFEMMTNAMGRAWEDLWSGNIKRMKDNLAVAGKTLAASILVPMAEIQPDLRQEWDELVASWDAMLSEIELKTDEHVATTKEKMATDAEEGVSFWQMINEEILASRQAATDAEHKAFTDLAKETGETWMAWQKQITDEAIKQFVRRKNEAIEELDEQLARGEITEQQYRIQRAAAEERAEAQINAQKLKAWKLDQMAKVTQTVMSTAMAIMNAMAQVPYPLNLIAAAAVGALGAAKVALIRQQTPPAFAEGGIAGMGGKQVITVGERGPEAVLPANMTKLLLDAAGTTNNSLNVEPGAVNITFGGETTLEKEEVEDVVYNAMRRLSDEQGQRNVYGA